MRNFLKFLVAALIFVFLFRNIVSGWTEIANYLRQLNPTQVVLGFVVLLLVYPEGAFGWHVVLKKMSVAINFKKSLRIWIIANTGRYIPGTIWQYIGRVELAKREAGISRNKVVLSLLVEIFLVAVAAALTSFFALPFISATEGVSTKWVALPLLVVLVGAVMFHPASVKKTIELIARVSKKDVARISWNPNFLVPAFPWFVLNFFLNGLALYLFVTAFGINITPIWFFAFCGFYASSWLIGYFSFFAPGGIGVADLTLAYLLSLSIPLSLASIVAVSYRFFLTIAELVVFAVALKIKND